MVGLITTPAQAFLDVGGGPLKLYIMGYIIFGLLVLVGMFMYMVLGASLTIELTHPRVKALVGFELWPADETDEYNTLKLHFIWLALRWDWV